MVKTKIILLVIIIALVVATAFFLFPKGQKNTLYNPSTTVSTNEIKPSETSIEYSDPSGFTFTYPDNLSISKNEVDENTYADLQLFSKKISGSLSLKISDSKLKSLDEWVNLNKTAAKQEPKEVKLGSVKAVEIKTSDRVLLGALDQGIFFTIEMPLLMEDFWMKVYSNVLTSFSFVLPEASTSDTVSSDDVAFEGEEIIE